MPSVDLLADFDFYKKFFGADFDPHHPMRNFSIARRIEGRAKIFFINVGSTSGYGLFLQEDYPPPSLRLLEGPRYGFAIAANDFISAVSVLTDNGIDFSGPFDHPGESPVVQSLYFKDPSDNSLELMLWRKLPPLLQAHKASGGLIPVLGLCNVAVDVTDLNVAEDFYTIGLGFRKFYSAKTVDGRAAVVLTSASGQLFTLQLVDQMSERSIKKYRSDTHLAISVTHEAFASIAAEMEKRKVPLLPDNVAGDGRRNPEDKNVYVVDPFGNNVQIFTPRKHRELEDIGRGKR